MADLDGEISHLGYTLGCWRHGSLQVGPRPVAKRIAARGRLCGWTGLGGKIPACGGSGGLCRWFVPDRSRRGCGPPVAIPARPAGAALPAAPYRPAGAAPGSPARCGATPRDMAGSGSAGDDPAEVSGSAPVVVRLPVSFPVSPAAPR